MAADVDKTSAENGSKISPETERQSPGSGSWLSRGLWTLLLVGVVPLIAFGVKYYQDVQLLKRHVRSASFTITARSLPLFLMFNAENKRGCDIVGK